MKAVWVVFILLWMQISSVWAQDPVLGDWYTVDDETGEVSSLVTLSQADDGSMVGIITKILKEDAGDGLCGECEGDKKDQPIEGMQFIWGVQNVALGKWEDGKLLDPESGTIYSGKLTLTEDPNELDVRGYVGFSLFGRSQTWIRVPSEGTE